MPETIPKPTVKLGDTGIFVSEVQTILKKLGYYKGEIDGIFGTQTEHAVKQFQANWGLKIDGIVGPATHDALDAAMQGAKPPSGIVGWIKAHKVLTAIIGGSIATVIGLVIWKMRK